MTNELRFDGQVAIVTGAGGHPSLGRSYALFLAERGARVVVNDLGVGPDGSGAVRAHPENVVAEIAALGGEAICDTHSVADERSATEIIGAALEAWGRLDILINNAGVIVFAPFDEIRSADIERVVSVHLMGSMWMCRAAWPLMKNQGYGRIVNVVSGAFLGQSLLAAYGAAKGGIFGLTRCLAAEGAEIGIKVNALGPRAGTAAVAQVVEDTEWRRSFFEARRPEQVAQVLALLAHRDCPSSGAYIETASGSVKLRFVGETAGYVNESLTPEDALNHWSDVLDQTGYSEVPLEADRQGGGPHRTAKEYVPPG